MKRTYQTPQMQVVDLAGSMLMLEVSNNVSNYRGRREFTIGEEEDEEDL